MNKKIILIFLLLFSCIKQVEIDLPEIENKPVVNCLFCVDSIFKVQISQLATLTGENEIPIIENAVCKLYCDDSFVEKLVYKNGFYYSQNTIAEFEKKYTIEVSTDIGNVSATSFSPSCFQNISNLEHQLRVGYYQEWNNAGDQPSTLSISFEDNISEKNYYEVFLDIFSIEFDSLWNEYLVKDYPNIASNENFVKEESILEYWTKFLTFTDILLSDSNVTLSILYLAPNYNDFYLISHFRSTSKELYLYRKSMIKHLYLMSLLDENATMEEALFSEIGSPVDLYSNVEGGYGIFAGYSERIDTIFVVNYYEVK